MTTPTGNRTYTITVPLWALIGLLAAALLAGVEYVRSNDSGEGADQARGATIYPTPAPSTFIVPTPIRPTSAPTLTLPVPQMLNQPAPDLTFALLDGGDVRLADFAGEVVFLNFWATWCAPCRAEMPLLQTLYTSGEAQVIAVTDPTDGQDEAAIRAFLSGYDLTLPVALTSDVAIYRMFEVAQIPMTYVIDRAGIVRFVHIGEMHDHDVVEYLDALEEQP